MKKLWFGTVGQNALRYEANADATDLRNLLGLAGSMPLLNLAK